MNTSFKSMAKTIGLANKKYFPLLCLLCSTYMGWAQAASLNTIEGQYYKACKLLENYDLREAEQGFLGLLTQKENQLIRLQSKLRLSHLYALLKKKEAYQNLLSEVQLEMDDPEFKSSFVEADYLYEKAKKIFKDREYEAVKDLCFKGLKILEKNKLDSTGFKSKLNVLIAKAAMFELNYERADSFYRTALKLLDKDKIGDQRSIANLYLKIAENYRFQQEYDLFLEYIVKANNIAKENPTYIEITGKCLKNLASHAYQTNQYNKSVDYYQQALDFYEDLDVDEIVFRKTRISLLIGLANVYRLKQDYEEALETAKYLIDYTKPKDGTLNLDHVKAYVEYAKIKDKGFGASSEIDSIYDFAIDFYKSEFGPNDSQYGYMMGNYATYLAIHKRYDASIDYALRAQKTFNGGSDTFKGAHSVANANLIGFVYTKLKKFDQAKKISSKVNEYYREKYNDKGTLVARSYGTLANLAIATKQYEKSIEYTDRGEAALQILDEETNKYVNGDYALHINLLKYKINAFQKLYDASKDLNYLKELNKICDQQIALIADSRRENAMSESNYSLSSKFYGSFSKSIETLYLLYAETSERAYLEDIFLKFEKSKSQSLLENYRSDDIMELVGVPKKMIKEKEDRMSLIKDTQERLRELKKHENDRRVAIQAEILELKHQYKSFLAEINEKYPEYEQKLYSQDIASLNDFQNTILDKDEMVISYLSSDNMLYCFAMTHEDVKIIKLDFDKSVKTQMIEYCENLGNNIFDDAQSKSIYLSLIGPEIESLLSGKNKIRIIPDAELNYLPFETLQKPNGQFLNEAHDISYAYSLQLMHDMNQKPSVATKNVLAFAPKYEENKQLSIDTSNEVMLAMLVRDGDYNLPGAKKEVQEIKDLLGAKTFMNEKATEKNFNLYADKYKVLHFAMHSIVNEEEPEGSQMLFYRTSNDSLFNGKLSVGELRKTKLNADLAVLSACNTGRGKIQKGEGLLSLSKAFSFAGVKSTIMSLWKVPDESSAFIMIEFYKNLKNGMDKDLALNEAKKSYLKSDKIPASKKTPYHWAGFVVSGSTHPIDLSQQLFFDPKIILGIILLVGMGLFLKMRNSRKLV